MSEELAIIENARNKIATDNRRKDVAILKQVLEPIEEGMGELSNSINTLMSFFEKLGTSNPEYYDKKLGDNVSSAIIKLSTTISNLKQSEIKIDLSPIASIAEEIKKGNDSIAKLLNTPNQSDEVIRMLSAYLNKQSIAFEKLTQMDYSSKLDELISAISNKSNDRIEMITFNYDQSGTSIRQAVPTYKK